MKKNEDINVDELRQKEIQGEYGSKDVSAEFIEENMSFVESVASNLMKGTKLPPGVEFSDLVSWGIEGLIKAKKKYIESEKAAFQSYAFYRVRGEILDKIRMEWKFRNPGEYSVYRQQVRERIAQYAEDQLDLLSPEDSAERSVKQVIENASMIHLVSRTSEFDVASEMEGSIDPEIEYVDNNKSVLNEEVDKLDPDEKELLNLIYKKNMKQVEISERLNYSRSKVCRMHAAILEKLKKMISKRYEE